MTQEERQARSAVSRTSPPCYRVVIGGLWAFIVRGGWRCDPGEPKPCYDEIQVLSVNAVQAPNPLCDHWPVMILDKRFLQASHAERCGNPDARLPPSHREVLLMGPDGRPFDALVLPLVGRSVAFINQELNTCIEVPDTGGFLSVIDLHHPALDAGPADPELAARIPVPDGLVNAKLSLNKGRLLGHRPTEEEIDFRDLSGAGSHQQRYCRQAIWELETNSRLVIHASSCVEDKVDKILLRDDQGPVYITVSNYCAALPSDEQVGDADDVRAFYELSERPIAEVEKQYPVNHQTGSSDDFCPPVRLSFE